MHVALAGAGEPLVLLHGWPQHWWQWRHLIAPLAQHYQVICPDLRGLGWTEAPPTGYTAETQAEDIIGLLDQLGVRRFRLIGHDWGGAAGYLLALRHPRRVARYIAINTANPFLRPTPRVLLNGARLWHALANTTRPTATPIPAFALRHWTRHPDAITPPDRALFLAQFREPERRRATVRYYRNLVGREIPLLLAGKYRWSRLTVPTLVLAGDHDPLLPPTQLTGFGRHATDLRVELLDQVGHFPPAEAPDRVLRRALPFLAASSG
jgi:pimeloyl-ACP methyl ester carboxylesterase